MIVFIGGLVGSGKRRLARFFAQKKGFFEYPVYAKRLRTLVRDRSGQLHERVIPSRTDAERLRIYANIAAEFPRLAKMYPKVLIVDSLHRAGPRAYLLTEAAKHFRDVRFVWVRSTDAHTLRRVLARNPRAKGEVEEISRRKELQERECEMPTDALFIDHKESLDEAAESLELHLKLS